MGELFRLDESWAKIDAIIPFGYGRVGKRTLPKLQEIFSIPFVIDNNPEYQKNTKIDIYGLKEALQKRKEEKIVVLTVGRLYRKIKEELEQNGLEEYKDFCILERFWSEWHLRYQHKCYLSKIDTVITSRCSLSCPHCAMFIHHCNAKQDVALNDLRDNFDALFHVVDEVLEYTLLGGEPLLHKNIKDILTYLGDKYGERVGRIVLITNGNADVDDELLDILQKCKVILSVSDYTAIYHYEKRLTALTQRLAEKGISYYFNKEMEWKDHGYPNAPANYPEDKRREHMMACGHTAHSVNYGKLYYCDPMFGAERHTNYVTQKEDVLDLRTLKDELGEYEAKERIIRYCWGEVNDKGYPSLCQYCAGIGWDNDKVIPAGM